MLQQTQVSRVIEKYTAFLKQFPTVRSLAAAPLRDVLAAWQGLGYNRRAKMLHTAAQAIVSNHKGRVPHEYVVLKTLPGIGPYTAGAVCAFAYDIPIPIVETNIRTVLFHHLLGTRTEVPDSELLILSGLLLDKKKPREWYYAMMDYGAFLKTKQVRLNTKSKHYTKQSKFEGSDRQVRGAILRILTIENTVRENTIIEKAKAAPARVHAQLAALQKEGLVRRQRGRWMI
jgi:A/G-specific adenine glycosylase